MDLFPTRILLATDGSEEAQRAAEVAAQLVKKTDSELHVMHVLDIQGYLGVKEPPKVLADSQLDKAFDLDKQEQEARRLLDEQVENIEGAGETVAEKYLMVGAPDEAIIRLSEDIDAGTIVIGSRGLSTLKRLAMGSVSEGVVRHAHCPVYVVRTREQDGMSP